MHIDAENSLTSSTPSCSPPGASSTMRRAVLLFRTPNDRQVHDSLCGASRRNAAPTHRARLLPPVRHHRVDCSHVARGGQEGLVSSRRPTRHGSPALPLTYRQPNRRRRSEAQFVPLGTNCSGGPAAMNAAKGAIVHGVWNDHDSLLPASSPASSRGGSDCAWSPARGRANRRPIAHPERPALKSRVLQSRGAIRGGRTLTMCREQPLVQATRSPSKICDDAWLRQTPRDSRQLAT